MSVPHAILRLLIDGPSHGYDLQRRLTGLRHFYPLRNVNVYPALKDLESQGLARSHAEIGGARLRKIYEITADGVAAFERWIDEPPPSAIADETDVVALKLVLAPDRSEAGLDWLPDTTGQIEESIRYWREYIEENRASLPRLALLTARHRLSCYELRREYLAEAARLAAEGDADAEAPRVPRILVADDSRAARALTRHLLAGAGYEVELAEDGNEAWERLRETEYAALVSDVEMPELDGFELLRRVRNSQELGQLPVILNTVLDGSEDRVNAFEAGADDYVCKGLANSGRRLVDCVARVTRES